MLGSARLQTLVWTSDIAQARKFYSDVLGLGLVTESFGALVYNVAGSELRVSPVPATAPSAHTVLGFAVQDIDEVIAGLDRNSIPPVRFPNFVHDIRGIWTAPDGTMIVWFRDPDGNLLSAVQYSRLTHIPSFKESSTDELLA
jgi:catechol 2,3-dioxygenase-like lactoylglutathione lyase family enzyme